MRWLDSDDAGCLSTVDEDCSVQPAASEFTFSMKTVAAYWSKRWVVLFRTTTTHCKARAKCSKLLQLSARFDVVHVHSSKKYKWPKWKTCSGWTKDRFIKLWPFTHWPITTENTGPKGWHVKIPNLGLSKEKWTRAGLEPATFRLTCRCSTNWAI